MHNAASYKSYIYGSAEVIGLLCVSVFLAGRKVETWRRARMATGAQALGAAFQKINFLRDYAEDHATLGRQYFTLELTEATKKASSLIFAPTWRRRKPPLACCHRVLAQVCN